LKYLIRESQARAIRRWCLDHLPPDPHALRRPEYEYPIRSIYLDSPSRALLQQTVAKQLHRYKLRVRTYRKYDEPAADVPAFFEIKRKLGGVVQKTRARVDPGVADALLWQQVASLNGRGGCDVMTESNLNEFLELRTRLGAAPVVGVFYMRQAYEANSADRVRITLDQKLRYGLLAAPRKGRCDMWWPVNAGGVILEVKFTNTYPFWVAEMLHRFDVVRQGVCKYVACSRAAGTCPEQAPEQRATR